MFRYHVVGCRQLSSQELLEEGYVTTLSGHPLRIHEREVGPGPVPRVGRPPPWTTPQSWDATAFKPGPCAPGPCPRAFKTLSPALGLTGFKEREREREESGSSVRALGSGRGPEPDCCWSPSP